MNSKEHNRMMWELKDKFSSEQIKEADKVIADLEKSGFFRLCGCSREETDLSTDGQKKD